uniref:DUF4283 domain-containing protein n=1 Tax=Lactuca sativa TaxID=4236 RepID=A0A9R1V962_LACSA|nr:hypothetical protein LSAT_V11C600298590 [Lactuca sativa]
MEVRKSSKKSKSNYKDVNVLGSFHFEESPQKTEDLHGVLLPRETSSSSSSSVAVCVSNHSQKGNFFTNSPIISEIHPAAIDVGEEVNSHVPGKVLDGSGGILHVNIEALEGPVHVREEDSGYGNGPEATLFTPVDGFHTGDPHATAKPPDDSANKHQSNDLHVLHDGLVVASSEPAGGAGLPPFSQIRKESKASSISDGGEKACFVSALRVEDVEEGDEEATSVHGSVTGVSSDIALPVFPSTEGGPLPSSDRRSSSPTRDIDSFSVSAIQPGIGVDSSDSIEKPPATFPFSLSQEDILNEESQPTLVGVSASQAVFLGDKDEIELASRECFPMRINCDFNVGSKTLNAALSPSKNFDHESPRSSQRPLSFAEILKGGAGPTSFEPNPKNLDAATPRSKNCAVGKIDMVYSKPISLNYINNFEILEDDHILIPNEIMEKGSVPFEKTLYGYFVGKRLAFPLVKERLEDLWKEHGICDIFINHDDMFFFKFENTKGMNYVLQKGIWKINGIPLFLRKWDPDVFIEKPTHDRVPVWVNIFGIPLQLFNKDGLSLIASKLGKPLEVDSYTSTMCERATGRAVFARILIEMSANAPWAKEIKIKAITAKGATSTSLRVEYSWLPKRCDHCKTFGHDQTSCSTHTTSSPAQKMVTPITKEDDNQGFQTVKKRTRSIPIPKMRVQVNNRKEKGPALKITQVYKPLNRDPKEKNVSSNMFDALSHQRIHDIEDSSSSPPAIPPRDILPTADSIPSSSHGGHIPTPVDQG